MCSHLLEWTLKLICKLALKIFYYLDKSCRKFRRSVLLFFEKKHLIFICLFWSKKYSWLKNVCFFCLGHHVDVEKCLGRGFVSVADSDPGSGGFVTWIRDPVWEKIRIRDQHSGSYFLKFGNNFFWLKTLKFFDADPGSFWFEKEKFGFGIRFKHTRSATVVCCVIGRISNLNFF